MKKLSWLVSSKKKTSKSSPRKEVSVLPEEGDCDGKDQLGHLSAQDGKDRLGHLSARAGASLGKLLEQAGASYSARAILQERRDPSRDHPQNPKDFPQSNIGRSSAAAKAGGSFRGSDGEERHGHSRRNSLSRILQQMGGSLFCGSGPLKSLSVEETELRRMPPMPQAPLEGQSLDVDMVADESYWQSLAETIIMQRQKATLLDQPYVDGLDEAKQNHTRDFTAKTRQDVFATSVSASQHTHMASKEVAGECFVSEILSASSSGVEGSDGQENADAVWRCAECGAAECSLEDDHNVSFVAREIGHGCLRMNTALDASPNLAHNYQLHVKDRADIGAMSCSSKNGVKLLNYYSCLAPIAPLHHQAKAPSLLEGAASITSPAFVSSCPAKGTDQLHEVSELNEFETDPLADTAACLVPTLADLIAQNQPDSATNSSSRVSLMALLYEEAAASVNSVQAPCVGDHGGQAQVVTLLEEEGLVCEEPLALYCCVCMVRRKGAALIPCGHTFCRICSKQLYANRGACPLCNNLIVQLLDIF